MMRSALCIRERKASRSMVRVRTNAAKGNHLGAEIPKELISNRSRRVRPLKRSKVDAAMHQIGWYREVFVP